MRDSKIGDVIAPLAVAIFYTLILINSLKYMIPECNGIADIVIIVVFVFIVGMCIHILCSNAAIHIQYIIRRKKNEKIDSSRR